MAVMFRSGIQIFRRPAGWLARRSVDGPFVGRETSCGGCHSTRTLKLEPGARLASSTTMTQIRMTGTSPPSVPDHPASHQVKQDDVPEETVEEHEKTIYKGILSTQIKLVKTFSLMTSAIGVSCQPLFYYKVTQGGGVTNVALFATGAAMVSFFTFATPLLIHWVSKKYVTELLYNKIEDNYTAITYTLFLRPRKITFRPDDVNVPDIPGMFTTFKVGRTALFVDGSSFLDVRHYGKIMGYDKPLDFRWKHDKSEK